MKRLLSWRPSQWEIMLAVMTIAAGAWSAKLSPYYLSLDQIAQSTQQFIFPGLLAMGLMVVVVLGEIDISLRVHIGSGLRAVFEIFGLSSSIVGRHSDRSCRSVVFWAL